MKKTVLLSFIAFFMTWGTTQACTNFLITPGASADGSSIVTYAADSHQLYGELYFFPSADWAVNSTLAIYEWDTGKYLGKIPQVPHTYQVIGNMNEHQVIIGETTYTGISQLGSQDGAIMDYGSLIYIALQRSKTAREAIQVMTELVEKYGYFSTGESFSVADKNEVWIFELIGKGNFDKGAVWVALRIPDGYVSAHANQARIMTFNYQKENKWDDPNATVFNSVDVISFAKENELYSGKDKDFSFSDVYAPVDFGGARFCEMRVWSFFKDINAGIKTNADYFEYAKGTIEHNDVFADGSYNPNLFASNRMPLWIKPDKKINVNEVMNYMRDHLEGTELDMCEGVGAGPYHKPYRWRGLTWEHNEKTYFNERITATQQTGFSFVAQARKNLPDPIGGIFWFSVDDAASTVYVPLYCGIKHAPKPFAEGNGSMMQWSETSAFWIFNQVSNLVYTRYDAIHPEVELIQQKLEKKYVAYTPVIDNAAKTLYAQDKDLGLQFITDYSVNTSVALVNSWTELYRYLFMKYLDGNVKPSDNYQLIDNGQNTGIPKVTFPGYSEEFYQLIIDESGDKFEYHGSH